MKGKRLISIMLCILMCVSMFPLQAFAESEPGKTSETPGAVPQVNTDVQADASSAMQAEASTAADGELSPETLFDIAQNRVEASPRKDGSGFVDVTAHYHVEAEIYLLLDDFRLFLSLPENAEVDLNSAEQNHEPAENFTLEAGNRLIIPLEDREGYVRFAMRFPAGGTVSVAAEISCALGEESFRRSLETVSARVERFYVEAIHQGDTAALFCGYAPAGGEVRIFYGNTQLGSAIAGEEGSFSVTVSSAGWAEGTVRTFRADVSAPGYAESRNLSIFRKADVPQLRAFRYYDHAGAETYIDLYTAIQDGSPTAITYEGNDEPFRFEIEYDNSDSIGRLFVTAERKSDGQSFSLEAERADGKENLFVAEGYFVEGNKHYAPDSIRLEYTGSASRTVDAVALAAEENGLYSAITDSLPEVQVTPGEANTETNSTYTIEFPENANADLAKTAIEYSIRAFDVVTGLEMFDHYKNDLNYASYIVPGLNDEKYYLNLDLSDPDSLKVLIVDTAKAVDGAVEMIVDCYDRNDTREEYLKWWEISETIGTVTSVIGTVADIYEIESDIAKLREQIDQSTTMTDTQKQEAHAEATKLNGDRMAFLLLTTAMPIIVASGGMGAPVALFGVMMAAMGTASDYFFEHRVTSILDADVPNQGNRNGSASFVGDDGLLYSVDYVLRDTTHQVLEWPDLVTYYEMSLELVEVLVTGTGPATESTDHIKNKVKAQVEVPAGYTMYSGGIERLSYQEGITGLPESASNARKLSIPGTATETLPDFSKAKHLKTAGPSMAYDIEFHWTDIPGHAFYQSHLTSVMLPQNCKSIGDGAFRDCSELSSVFFNDGLKSIGHIAFDGCMALTSVVLPATLTDDAGQSFVNSGVTYASFADGTTRIPANLFMYCYALRKIRLPDSLTEVGINAFRGTDLLEVEFPQDAEVTIGAGAFAECASLRRVRLPKAVPQGGRNCFYLCDKLKTAGPAGGDYDIEFPFETDIPAELFWGSSLESVVLPEGMKTIGNGAFREMVNLEELDLPVSIDFIGSGAFAGCTFLREVRIPKEANVLLGEAAFKDCTSLVKVWLPKTVRSHGSVFEGCSGLETAGPAGGGYNVEMYLEGEFPRGLFRYTRNLRSLVIPEGVQSIGSYAFRDVLGLEELILPDSLQSIGEDAFQYCENLKMIRFPANPVQFPDTNPEQVFYNCDAVEELVLSAAELETGRFFSWFRSLSRLRLEDGVTEVSESQVPGFRKIFLPASVTSFRFTGGLTELHDLYYAGEAGRLNPVNNPDTVKIHSGATLADWENNRETELAAPILTPEPSGTAVTLSWAPVEGAGSYTVCRDNVPIASGNMTQYTDTDVYPGMAYTYAVRCLSADMRGSSESAAQVRVLSDVEIAESGKLGSASYTVDINGKATVYGGGRVWLPETEDSYSPLYGFGNDYDQNLPRITSLEIMEGITEVGGGFGGIFARNGSLREVILPATLEHIGKDAFEACYSIRTVRFGGNSDQWQAVRTEEGNGYLLEAEEFYLNYTEPVLRYRVIFDGNRFGSSYQDTYDMPAQKILYDVPTKLNRNLFSASSGSLAFNGWNTARDGSGERYPNEAEVLNLAEPGESVTLYAQWRERTDRIEAYVKGTKETGATYTVDYGTSIRLEIETPVDYPDPLTCIWTVVPCDIDNEEYYYDLEETVTGPEPYLDLTGVTTDFVIVCKVQTDFSYPVTLWFDIYCNGSTPTFGKASFTLPAALSVIEESAFEGDASITVVDASHCIAIGANAFKDCRGLVKIRLPKNCEIDATAFSGCQTVSVFAPAGGTTQTWADTRDGIVFVEEVQP